MREFILDLNVDLKPHQKNYPSYFFEDLRKSGKVTIVIGGTTYRAEVRLKPSLLELIGQLISSGKVRTIPDQSVDEAQKKLEAKIEERFESCPRECDDPHIFALALVSGCMNVISRDARIASCRNQIRNVVGHDHCADVRVIQDQAAYNRAR